MTPREIDSVCPHGPSETRAPALTFVDDTGLFEDGRAIIYDPEDSRDAWIEADREDFLEVESR
jgi:hypothetical protein